MSADLGPAGDQLRAGNGAAAKTPGERIRAESVTAGYGGDPVIRGISLQCEPGQVVSMVGPNGSGKSTLLKSLVGVVRVSSGKVLVGERSSPNMAPEEVARAGVGYVPQVDDVFPPLSVRENLEMGGYLLHRKRNQRAHGLRAERVPPARHYDRQAGRKAERRRAQDAGHGPGADARAGGVPARRADCEPRAGDRHVAAGGARPASLPSGCRGRHRGAAGQGRACHLRLHLRARRGELRMAGTPAELSASPDFVDSFLGGRRGRAVPSAEA